MIWLIGLGGSLGAAGRYILSRFLNKTSYPVGTWLINVSGSFFLGLLANLYLSGQISEWLWYFGGIGFCGAFTTFSTFGYESITLFLENRVKRAILYIITSVFVSVIMAMIGFLIM